MEAENTLTLFDSFWFELEILNKQSNPSKSDPNPSKSDPNPDQKSHPIPIQRMESSSIFSSFSPSSVLPPLKNKKKKMMKRGLSLSKSLSDLEFEEVKGFMELGFEFSEEDGSSEFLGGILPGLQRKVKEKEGISRPYLSEAWRVAEKKGSPPLMRSLGELPCVGSEIDMKEYLRSWAHTVASSVR